MSEYEAELIERYDRDVLEIFITETMRQNPGITRDISRGNRTIARAQAIQSYAAHLSQNSLSGLERSDQNSQEPAGPKSRLPAFRRISNPQPAGRSHLETARHH